MAKTSNLASVAPTYDANCEYTRERIYAYLLAVRPFAGLSQENLPDGHERGRKVIQAIADSSFEDRRPTKRLTIEQCADVIEFIQHSEPRDPVAFHKDPRNAPSAQVGLLLVFNAVEASLRRKVSHAQV